MDLSLYKAVLEPVVQLFSGILLSGVATTTATQLLKLNFIPIPVTKYPRLSAAVVAVLASLVTIYNTNLELVLDNWVQVVAFMVGVFITSVVVYNAVIKTGEDSPNKL